MPHTLAATTTSIPNVLFYILIHHSLSTNKHHESRIVSIYLIVVVVYVWYRDHDGVDPSIRWTEIERESFWSLVVGPHVRNSVYMFNASSRCRQCVTVERDVSGTGIHSPVCPVWWSHSQSVSSGWYILSAYMYISIERSDTHWRIEWSQAHVWITKTSPKNHYLLLDGVTVGSSLNVVVSVVVAKMTRVHFMISHFRPIPSRSFWSHNYIVFCCCCFCFFVQIMTFKKQRLSIQIVIDRRLRCW